MEYFSDRNQEGIYELSIEELERLFVENQEDIARIKSITDERKKGKRQPNNMIEFFQSFLEDSNVDGFVMRYPHGNVVRQGERRNYYRGELCERYPSSKTSLFREMDKCRNKAEREVVYLIAKMRAVVFQKILERLKYTERWATWIGSMPYFEAIAQHYGLMTELLDITNDFNVAMFFACCKWIQKDKSWRPLTLDECRDIGYGILYHAPSDRLQFYMDFDKTPPLPKVIPVGFQPFYRCQKQVGYVIKMEEDEDLQNNKIFERLKFKHSVQLSEGVFDYMNQGKDIYPDEDMVNLLEDIIQKIQATVTLSTDVFDCVIKKIGKETQREALLEKLRRADFKIGNNIYKDIVIEDGIKSVVVPRQTINRINLKTEKRNPEDDNFIKLTSRYVFYGK